MGQRFRLLLLSGILAWSVGWATRAVAGQGSQWGYTQIVQLIRDRAHTGRPLRSVDELLAAFPPELKRYFTFVYATRNRFQDASPLFPRAIVFTKKLLYTFNGHSSQRGYQSVELMEFDRARRRFELREIRFGYNASVEYSSANPRRCLECHGSDPKPIWNAYDQWPGVYGSDDDRLPEPELRQYQRFLTQVRRDPNSRYRHLEFPADATIPPYGQRAPGTNAFRINLLLTSLLTQMNALRVARLLEESPYYYALRWLLPDLVVSHQFENYLMSYGCDLPDGIIDKLVPLLARAARTTLAHRKLPSKMPDILFAAFGLPVERVSMQLGATAYEYADGSALFLNALRMALLHRLVDSHTELARRLVFKKDSFAGDYFTYSLYQDIDDLVGKFEDISPEHPSCGVIGDEAESEISALPKTGLPTAARNSNSSDDAFDRELHAAQASRLNEAIPLSCVLCHAIQTGAPRIAFDNEEALRSQLRADGSRLLREILRRIDPQATKNGMMPPENATDFPTLTSDERGRFESYLRGL